VSARGNTRRPTSVNLTVGGFAIGFLAIMTPMNCSSSTQSGQVQPGADKQPNESIGGAASHSPAGPVPYAQERCLGAIRSLRPGARRPDNRGTPQISRSDRLIVRIRSGLGWSGSRTRNQDIGRVDDAIGRYLSAWRVIGGNQGCVTVGVGEFPRSLVL